MMSTIGALEEGINFAEREAIIRRETKAEGKIIALVAAGVTGETIPRGSKEVDSSSGITIHGEITGKVTVEVGGGITKGVVLP